MQKFGQCLAKLLPHVVCPWINHKFYYFIYFTRSAWNNYLPYVRIKLLKWNSQIYHCPSSVGWYRGEGGGGGDDVLFDNYTTKPVVSVMLYFEISCICYVFVRNKFNPCKAGQHSFGLPRLTAVSWIFSLDADETLEGLWIMSLPARLASNCKGTAQCLNPQNSASSQFFTTTTTSFHLLSALWHPLSCTKWGVIIIIMCVQK